MVLEGRIINEFLIEKDPVGLSLLEDESYHDQLSQPIDSWCYDKVLPTEGIDYDPEMIDTEEIMKDIMPLDGYGTSADAVDLETDDYIESMDYIMSDDEELDNLLGI